MEDDGVDDGVLTVVIKRVEDEIVALCRGRIPNRPR